MRVLFVTDWPVEGGGIESYLTTVSAELREYGDEVRLLTSSVGGGSTVADYVAPGSRNAALQSVLQIANPAASRTMRRAIEEYRPDVVHVSMFEMHLSPSVVIAARGVPVILSVAYYKPVCPNALRLRPDDTICRSTPGKICWRGGCLSLAHWLRDLPRYARIEGAVRSARDVITCSRWMQGVLAQSGLRAQFDPWPVARPSPSFARRPSADPLFAVVGRLSREKGVDTLLRALAAARRTVPAIRLRVIGDGPMRLSLERLCDELQIRQAVEFTGWIAADRVEAHLADAWAVVVPSRWAEPLGLTAVEAIVRGIPVIATATGGLAESVEEGVSGLLVPNGDVQSLAARLADVASRRRLAGGVPGETVRRMRERHDPARHARWLRAVLAEAAA